ncbi:alanyl-tRNA editing protein [Treponema sp. OttesenSCG-928-L16]|nr:alanyl-tRNA editing protein [Treponema sp. OttesenSCG-928-L16]
MKLLYQHDAYLKEIETLIESADDVRNAVTFAETIVYPGGGGQPFDIGNFECNGEPYSITRTEKTDAGFHYILDKTPPPAGSAVRLVIDWERRYALMRTHTAMHILCGVIWRDYKKAVTGGNMDVLKARMDFEFEGFSAELSAEIEAKINEEAALGRDVRVEFLKEGDDLNGLIRTKENLIPAGVEQVRLINIAGLDVQADGGTHVKNTKEVGTIHITGFENKGRINKRIKVEIHEV